MKEYSQSNKAFHFLRAKTAHLISLVCFHCCCFSLFLLLFFPLRFLAETRSRAVLPFLPSRFIRKFPCRVSRCSLACGTLFDKHGPTSSAARLLNRLFNEYMCRGSALPIRRTGSILWASCVQVFLFKTFNLPQLLKPIKPGVFHPLARFLQNPAVSKASMLKFLMLFFRQHKRIRKWQFHIQVFIL